MSDRDLDTWLRTIDTDLHSLATAVDLVSREAQRNTFAIRSPRATSANTSTR